MTKPFLTYAEQLHKLEQEKGLVISDKVYALAMLESYSYYSLISGYKNLYRFNKEKYKRGTTFEEICALYQFDELLRSLFLKELFRVEQKMRSLISYHFTQEFGSFQEAYTNPMNFKHKPKTLPELNKLISILQLRISSNKKPYIKYQRETYKNVPLWVLVKSLTFGELSKMYGFLPDKVKSSISKSVDGLNEKELGKCLEVLSIFRNVCAHNERFYDYKSIVNITDTKFHETLAKKGNTYQQGKNDLFAVVIAFRYFLQEDDFCEFLEDLQSIIADFLQTTTNVTKVELLNEMGFPVHWIRVLTI